MLDVSKITCWQFATHKVADPKLIAVWISGFKKGKRGDTLVDTEKLDADAEKLRRFCISNPDMPVMDAVEKVVSEPALGPRGTGNKPEDWTEAMPLARGAPMAAHELQQDRGLVRAPR
jgi:hypothetical protein